MDIVERVRIHPDFEVGWWHSTVLEEISGCAILHNLLFAANEA
jgi:hypothetical protein